MFLTMQLEATSVRLAPAGSILLVLGSAPELGFQDARWGEGAFKSYTPKPSPSNQGWSWQSSNQCTTIKDPHNSLGQRGVRSSPNGCFLGSIWLLLQSPQRHPNRTQGGPTWNPLVPVQSKQSSSPPKACKIAMILPRGGLFKQGRPRRLQGWVLVTQSDPEC